MVRWLIWFAIGIAIIVWPFHTHGFVLNPPPEDTLHAFLGLGWLVVTGFAVPIAIIRWLIKGKSRDTHPRPA